VLGARATPERVRRAVRGCFRAAAWYYADLARTPRMRPARFIRENIDIHGFENFEAAYARGKGVIVATIHSGNPEYVAQSMSAWGYRFLALTEPLEPQALADLIQRLRSSQGQTFVEVGMAGIKASLRHLKSGGVVCIMCDRDIQHAGETISFFGCPANIPSGAVDLARHTGAAIIPAFTRRVGLDGFEAWLEPELELIRTGRVEADRIANTTRLIQRFEPHLRRVPSQWFVLEEQIWPNGNACAAQPASRAISTGR
jgi:lauroyl/myristoyl acyltransferase